MPEIQNDNTPPPPAPESVAATLKRLGPAGVFAAIAAVMPAIGGILLIGFMPTVAMWLRSHGGAGPWVYGAAFALLAGLALLPTYAQAALGGYAFGMSIGLVAALAGFAGGAIIGYEIARRAGGDRVMRIVREKPKLAAVRDAFVSEHAGASGLWKTTGLVALVRMPPNSPFALMNVLLASIQVPRPCFIIGTVVGMLPRTAAAVWIGTSVDLAASAKVPTPGWLVAVQIAAAVVALGVVMLIADRAVKKVTRAGAAAAPAKKKPGAPQGAGSPET